MTIQLFQMDIRFNNTKFKAMATKMKVNDNFPKFSLMILVLLMTITCYCQSFQVSSVAPGHINFKYGCITSQQTYDIEYMAYRLSGLIYDKAYLLYVHNSTIFDNTGFEPYPPFTPYGSYWKWPYQGLTVDTVSLRFWGNYSNINLNSSEFVRFDAQERPNGPGGFADMPINVYTDMAISGGNDPFCSTPVSFTLLNLPSSYTTANWSIKQGGVVKASGTGSVASTSNISNGPGSVTYTVHFQCSLKDLTFTKNFWLGTPIVSVSGPSSGCTNNTYYFTATPTGPSSGATNYTWDLVPLNGNYLSPYGSQNSQCAITFYNPYSASGYWVKARAQNTCGTGAYGQTNIWIHTCYSFTLSPNPATDNVTLTKIVNGSLNGSMDPALADDATTIYTVKMYDIYGVLVYESKFSGNSYNFLISKFKLGNYIILITDGINVINLQLVIK
jgi:hypothetical protein